MDEKPKIIMTKEKEKLVFIKDNCDYRIEYNLNTGEYTKVHPIKGRRNIKHVNDFFANVYYGTIIDEKKYPVYAKMIEMAARQRLAYQKYGFGFEITQLL